MRGVGRGVVVMEVATMVEVMAAREAGMAKEAREAAAETAEAATAAAREVRRRACASGTTP